MRIQASLLYKNNFIRIASSFIKFRPFQILRDEMYFKHCFQYELEKGSFTTFSFAFLDKQKCFALKLGSMELLENKCI